MGPFSPGQTIKGPYWEEPLRLLSVQPVGKGIRIEAVGVRSQRYYDHILQPDDQAKIQILPQETRDFTGNAEAFFLALEANRIRLAYQFDPFLAINISQVDPLPHQIEAVYHHILRQPRIRFLLADDPGAGKTIMAGLILKELKARDLVRRALIVVPGHLRDQWLREMKERFGETFTVVDRGVVSATWGRNIWQEQPWVITSMDFAKQDDVLVTLAETEWDLVIVDEAHKLAAYRYGEKVNKTQRYRLGEVLSRISHFLLFLTATPHRGDPENFRLFIDLLLPGMFANSNLLMESLRKGDNPLFLRRLKEDLRDFNGRPLFPPRYVHTHTFRLHEDEKRLYNAVTDYVQREYNKAFAAEKRNVAFALLILQRRLASSIRAVRKSLERRRQKLEELLQLGRWLAERDTLDEEALEDAPELERMRQEEDLLSRLTAAETREELEAEIRTLEELIKLARAAESREVETKLNELRKVMEHERIRQSGEKLLIFTECRDTLEYLAERLKAWGYTVVTLHGAMNLDERIRAEHEFRERAQVMVSTEAGGEGINLQFCSLMVNYDIPWNPNRLEQRLGRIHRYGQRKEVHIYNLVASETLEGRVMEALFHKLERIRAVLGSDRVFDVIGEVVMGRSLQELIVDAITQRRTLDEILAEIEAIPDEEAIRKAKEAAMEALATRHINLQEVLGESRRARESRLVPEYIEQFFLRSARFLGLRMEKRQDGLWRLPYVPSHLRNVSQEFRHLYGEVFPEYNKFSFDKEIARQKEGVFVAPGHPLLESIIEKVLEQCSDDLRKGAVFADPDNRLDGYLWFLEGEIRDGAGEVVGRRLFAFFQPAGEGNPQPVNSSILWDLCPLPPGTDVESPPEEPIIAFCAETLLEDYRRELLRERERHAEIRRRYGLRSLDILIQDSQLRLINYATRRAKGEPIPEMEIQNEERRKEELMARRAALEEEIRRQTYLVPATPRILGVVRVIPYSTQLKPDEEIEAVGMQVAMDYERAQGRIPQDVSAQNLGYDIRSKAPMALSAILKLKPVPPPDR